MGVEPITKLLLVSNGVKAAIAAEAYVSMLWRKCILLKIPD